MQELLPPVSVSTPQITDALLPPSIAQFGAQGRYAWEEFFAGKVRNVHTRKAYAFAVRRLLNWLDCHSVNLQQTTPGIIGRYFDEHPGSIPTKKLHMAAIRGLFDVLVLRHVLILNPALSVRTERYSVTEGKTLLISVEQTRQLLLSIKPKSAVDYRDQAIIGILSFTAVRAGAIAKLRVCDLVDEGNQRVLRFSEKGSKKRIIPVRSDLEELLNDYVREAKVLSKPKDSPFFRTGLGRTGSLSENSISGIDICRMVKRRLKSAKLPTSLSPHSFRAKIATDLLEQGVSLSEVQLLLGHSDSRVTELYDRRQRHVTRNTVERISV